MPRFISKVITVIVFLVILCLEFGAVGAETGWVRNPSNPVLSPSSTGWDSWQVYNPRLIYDGSTYHMWYTAYSKLTVAMIGYATSTDGITWMKHGDPVLRPGGAAAWDSYEVSDGSVMSNGSVYQMFYLGKRNGTYARAIGLATSNDGITWTKFPGNPVMTTTNIDAVFLSYPWVLKVGNQFKMYYTCRPTSEVNARTCLATSTDVVHWVKLSTPIFLGTGNPSDWDAGEVYSPNVLYDGNVYGMWYSACNLYSSYSSAKCEIGYATSSDGIAWTRAAGNPILGPSSSGWDSDSVDNQGILQVGGDFKLYYSADQGPLDSNGNPISYKIGVVQSPAGFALPEFHDTSVSVALPMVLVFSIIAINACRGRTRKDMKRGN
jgi:predicted GH43/DUF377 family glycosyl hydrolase